MKSDDVVLVNFKLSESERRWINQYAKRNKTTVSDIFRQHISELKSGKKNQRVSLKRGKGSIIVGGIKVTVEK